MTRITDLINLIEQSYQIQIKLNHTKNKINVYQRTIELYDKLGEQFFQWGDIPAFKELSSKSEGLGKQTEVLVKYANELDQEYKAVQINVMTLSKLKEQELNRNINLN